MNFRSIDQQASSRKSETNGKRQQNALRAFRRMTLLAVAACSWL